MTSDAKIGLLLGLIFIFIIAFVINGLPSLRPPLSKVGATTMLTDEDFTGVAGKTDEAVTDWTAQLDQRRTAPDANPTVAEDPKPAVQETPQAQPAAPQTASSEGIRSMLPLPSVEEVLKHLTPTIQKDRVATADLGMPGPALEPRMAPALEPKTLDSVTQGRETREPSSVAPAPSKPVTLPGSKLYVTVEGDNLATIAKKVYGPEDGNRVANIQRIFQANQALLKSPDSVFIGQKLIIPPPLPPLPKESITGAASASTKPAPSAARPADVLPKTLFEEPKTLSERVAALGRRAPASIPAPTPDDRWYVVQNGDSLWKIASTQLGSGSRCDEIAKLNAEILKSVDTLDVGMKLRLPPK